MNRIKRMAKRGFTLVELMIVVAIVGVLAALAIYGVRKYIQNAKTAEARNSLGQMGKDATTAFAREGMSASVLTLGASAAGSNHLCDSAAAVPTAAASIQGKKYQSTPSDWTTAAAADGTQKGWSCLKFSMEAPQYYMYNYTASGVQGVLGETFTGTANGDLDGDQNLSTFQINGSIQQDSKDNSLVVTVAPNLQETLPEE